MKVLESEILLNTEQVAEILQVSVDWVGAHCGRRAPNLPVVRVGKLLRFRRNDINRFIAEQLTNCEEAA